MCGLVSPRDLIFRLRLDQFKLTSFSFKQVDSLIASFQLIHFPRPKKRNLEDSNDAGRKDFFLYLAYY